MSNKNKTAKDILALLVMIPLVILHLMNSLLWVKNCHLCSKTSIYFTVVLSMLMTMALVITQHEPTSIHSDYCKVMAITHQMNDVAIPILT